jgi:hypothetical protein
MLKAHPRCNYALAGCCQTNASASQFGQARRSSAGAQRPPLGRSGGAGLLVVVAAGEVPLGVEVVVA